MAYRSWGKVLLAALGVGILVGAGQLGVAYGLGVVRFNRVFDAGAVSVWAGQLTWIGWFAAVAAVAGALLAERLASRYGLQVTIRSALALAGTAFIGALTVAPLSMQPARTAQLAFADPVRAAGLTAVLGATVGFGAALLALIDRPTGWNVAAIAGAVWLLAVLSVLSSLGPTDPLPAVRLGVLDSAWLEPGTAQRLAVVVMPAVALIAGAVTGSVANRRRWTPFVVTTSGLAGPAMIALAYLLAGPASGTDLYQAAPFWGAVLAVAAGALGSSLAHLAPRWASTRFTHRAESSHRPGSSQAGDSVEEGAAGAPATTAPGRAEVATPDGTTPDEITATTTDGTPTTTPAETSVTASLGTPATASGPADRRSTGGASATGTPPAVSVFWPDVAAETTWPPGAAFAEDRGPTSPPGPVETATERTEATAERTEATAELAGGTAERPEATAELAGGTAAASPDRTPGRGRRRLFRKASDDPVDLAPVAAGQTSESAGEPPAEPTKGRRKRGTGERARDVPARDEEYVDWVSGLGAPTKGQDAERTGRRSLRPHRDHRPDN